MFRLFIVNLLKSADGLPEKPMDALPARNRKNRRTFERYDIDHKHLTLMNEQDILLVRDLSENGFSTEVSARGFERFSVGDVYRCRIRYLGETYKADCMVVWKSSNFVGFTLYKPTMQMQKFIKRLLLPVEIGTSMQSVDEKFVRMQDNSGMEWYQGIFSTNVFIWRDEQGDVRSWELEDSKNFVKWDRLKGLKTGKFSSQNTASEVGHSSLSGASPKLEDKKTDQSLSQYAIDIFMAMNLQDKTNLVSTLVDS